MNTVTIKNISTESQTLQGIIFEPLYAITLTAKQIESWRTSLEVFEAVGGGLFQVGDGSSYFVHSIDGWNWLSGNAPTTIKHDSSETTPVQQAIKVSTYKAEGSSTISVSFDLCDPTTWHQAAIKKDNEILVEQGNNVFKGSEVNWIDTCHGKIYMEDALTDNALPLYYGGVRTHRVVVTVGGVEKLEDTDYVVNYKEGAITLASSTTEEVRATYFYATSNTFTIAPKEGKLLNIEHSELQFTTDMEITSPIHFDIYVYNPNDLPNKILYSRTVYKNIKDIINAANLGTGVIPPLSGIGKEICVFPFDYATLKTLKHSEGAELRISTKDNTPFNGTWGTCTFIMFSQDEV